MGATLRTKRLVLRPVEIADVDALQTLWSDADVRRFLFDDRVPSREDVRAFVEASGRTFAEHGWGIWIACTHGATEIAAFAGMLPPSDTGAPSLVYGTRTDLVGRGLASEAAGAVLAHAIDTLALPRVRADVDEPNVASVRVLQKLGMRRLGRRIEAGRPILDFEIEGGARAPNA